jgi:hypothetical protein
MATRSTIAIELEDGTVKQTYCHWDGYLDNNGKILLNHYSDPKKLLQLIKKGSISSLRPEVGKKHDFDARYEEGSVERTWTTFYGRDRGEKNVSSKKFKDFDAYKQDHQYEEYEYILRNTGEWQVFFYNNEEYVSLADAIAQEMLDNEMAADE